MTWQASCLLTKHLEQQMISTMEFESRKKMKENNGLQYKHDTTSTFTVRKIGLSVLYWFCKAIQNSSLGCSRAQKILLGDFPSSRFWEGSGTMGACVPPPQQKTTPKLTDYADWYVILHCWHRFTVALLTTFRVYTKSYTILGALFLWKSFWSKRLSHNAQIVVHPQTIILDNLLFSKKEWINSTSGYRYCRILEICYQMVWILPECEGCFIKTKETQLAT